MGKLASDLSMTEPDANAQTTRYDDCCEDWANRFDRKFRMNVPTKKFSIRCERIFRKLTGRASSSTERIVALTRVMLYQYGELHPESAYTDSEIETICKAAVLHDIGKLAIPAEILEKPERLLPEEAALMRKHTEYGSDFVCRIPKIASSPCARYFSDVCLMHHERWDGSGYPAGLCGDAIPLYVQIVSVVDAYDALVTTRLYKPTYSHDTAIEMIEEGECGLFNPAVIECLNVASDEIRSTSEAIRTGSNDKQKWIYGSLKRLSVSFTLTVSILLLAIGISVGFFASYLNRTIADDRVRRLSQIAESSAYYWKTRIESTFSDLEYIANHESPADPDRPELQTEFITKLVPYANYHKFYEFALLTSEERLYSSLLTEQGLSGDNARIYNSDFEALKAASRKTNHILAACNIYDFLTDSDGALIRDPDGIPVYRTDENGDPVISPTLPYITKIFTSLPSGFDLNPA